MLPLPYVIDAPVAAAGSPPPAQPDRATFGVPPVPGHDADLLDAVGAQPRDRVLIVGGGSPDLLCASIRRGCRSAMGVATPPAHPEAAEIVVAPTVTSLDEALSVAGCAHRALAASSRGGRLAIRLLGEGTVAMGLGLARHLRADGYAGIRARLGRDGGMVVTCRLPARAALR